MKKRFSAILMAVMMLLSFCSFTAFADTSLELTHYNIITNNIRLEFSGEVSNVTATLNCTDGTAITVTPTASSDSKIWNLKLAEKMDLSKEYVLDFTATGTDSTTLTAKKLIKFTVYDNETFDNYTQISDLDNKYKHYTDYNATNTKTISGSGKYELVTEEDGNKRLKVSLSGNQGFWSTAYTSKAKYYNFEADFETIFTSGTDKDDYYVFGIRHKDYNVPYGANVIMHSGRDYSTKTDYRYLRNKSAFFKDSQKFEDTDYSYELKNTYAFSLSNNGTNDIYDIYENGTNIVDMRGTYDGDYIWYILESEGTWNFYLDNYKLYSYSMTDVVDMAFDYINVTTKGITVAYNNDVEAGYGVQLLKGGKTEISATTTTKGNIINIIPAERLDLSTAYVLNVTNVKDKYTTAPNLSKLIQFTTIVDDDFSSYSSLADMTANYVGKAPAYGIAKDNISLADGKTTTTTGEDYPLGFEFDNENKRVKLTNNDRFLRTTANVGVYNTVEFDLESVSDTAKNPSFKLNTFTNCEYHTNSREWKLDSAGSGNLLDMANYQLTDYEAKSSRTFALTREKVSNGTFFELSVDGKQGYAYTDTASKYSQYNTTFGISANGGAVYLSDLKIYTTKVSDYNGETFNEMKLDYINVTTKGITVAYNENIAGTPKVTLKTREGAVATTLTTSGKNLTIKPATALDLSKQYILAVNASNGFYTDKFSKLITFDVIVDDNFDSYNQLSELDDTYYTMLNATNTKISECNQVELADDSSNGKRLHLKLNAGNGFWVKALEGTTNNYKHYNLEADFQYGSAIDDGDRYYISLRHNTFYVNTSNGNGDVMFHIGNYDGGVYLTNVESMFSDASKFSNAKYTANGEHTYAFSLTRNSDNTADVYNIAEDGKNIVNATGNVSASNFYYILTHGNGTGYGTYYLDNYKLYAPIITDSETFFVAEGDPFITSKGIKIDFNYDIDSSEANLAKVNVTSMGSTLAVTKTVSGKTLTIAPASGELPFNQEISYTIDGLKDTTGATAIYTAKSFKLQKLWYETFDNAETIADLYGDYHFAYGKEMNGDTALTSDTLKTFVTANPGVFSIDTQTNGNKRLAMKETKGTNGTATYKGGISHMAVYPGRNDWKNTITEFDFETSEENSLDKFQFNYRTVYSASIDATTGLGSAWYNPYGQLNFDNTVGKTKFSVMSIVDDTNKKATTYVDGEVYKEQTYNNGEGEFTFANKSSTATMYIDNIKVYKVVDFADDEYVWLTNTKAKTTMESETEKTTVTGTINIVSYSDNKAIQAGNAIVVAYDKDEKIIGINTVATPTVSANGNSATSYTIDCSSKDVYRVSAFVWDSLDGMKPLIQNRTTTDITIEK